MNSTHTPGPWEAHGKQIIGEDYVAEVHDHSNPNCAPQYADTNARLRARHEANARLIAAAPELLAVARTVKLWCEKGIIKTVAPYEGNESGLLEMARAAIAKAEGRT